MKRILLLLVLLLPLISMACAEWDYESDTGTLSLPWGEKEGTRNPEEALPERNADEYRASSSA